MANRRIPLTFEQLVEHFAAHDVYHTQSFVDTQTGEALTIAEDLIDYCRGAREGTDLQLSDSHELPAAQAVAEELTWLEQGFDEDGLPYGAADRRYFPIERLGGQPGAQIEDAVREWLARWELEPAPARAGRQSERRDGA